MNDEEKGRLMPSAEYQDESHEYFLENGKSEINELLWRLAPRSARLGELDDAAVFIYDRILMLWREDQGIATAGDYGTVAAGTYGVATVGDYGTATAGDEGIAAAGYYGTAVAGDEGAAVVGDEGIAMAGVYGTAAAGDYGIIQIAYLRGERRRILIGYIGEDGLRPGVRYRVEGGRFVEVDNEC